ncbi:hypothetical protein XENOCAPTIV_002431 [Xenoophorus captivus]|uniref:Actin interacting protein 3-like C-terminal domain-containing protein n=1 Tax=Xenoophorus captivus TaxID=1517983 RepID=A0ABV0R6E0_9TELE
MSPPMVRSMPSSPSRVAYVGGGSHGKKGIVDPGSATMPHQCQPGRGRSSTVFSSSSAILERRDVKPDGDINTSTALVLCGDGGSHYPECYRSASVDVGGGRHSIASYCSSPPVITRGSVDVGVFGIPVGLQQYRASIKPLMGYGESMERHTNPVHRQKSRKYGNNHIHPLGINSPPPSPHRRNEVRMFNEQVIRGPSQDHNSSGLRVDVISKRGSSSSTSSVFCDTPLEQPETLFMTACNTQSERMKAMEEQIASLAGLVHHALSMGSDAVGPKEAISQNAEHKLVNNEAVFDSEIPDALTERVSSTSLALQAPSFNGRLRQNLMFVKRDICELRLQLCQLKCLQLSNLESVSSMLRMASPKLVMLMCEKLAQSEDAEYRQRAEMEEDRIHYLTSEKKILTQLSKLEDYAECWESSSSLPGQPSFTLRDVEEGAVSLQRLGEALAVLKGEFPLLQAKMRSVLRLEVEAVRFLKEEPHKMDSMLTRVKALTETLSSLRRCVSDSTPSTRFAQVEPLKIQNQGKATTQSPHSSPKPQPRYPVKDSLLTPLPSMSQAEVSSVASASPIIACKMKRTATFNHHNSSPTISHGLDSPTVAKNTQRQSPEGGLLVEIKSINQSWTSRDSQLASNDHSDTKSIHIATDSVWVLQEMPHIASKSTVNISENKEVCCDSASGKKSLKESPSKQYTPVELTNQGRPVQPIFIQ